MSAFKYGCGEKGEKKPDGCKTGKITVDCYCTGTKCKHCNPTDKKDKKCFKGKSSANTIGAQFTVGFAVFLTVFNKVMA